MIKALICCCYLLIALASKIQFMVLQCNHCPAEAFGSGELIVYQWLQCPSVRQHFQTSSFLKILGQLNWYFIWRLLRMGERKFVQMVLITWPRWPPRPYMVKTLQISSSPEPGGQWPWDVLCSIGGVRPTKFV